MVPRSVALVLMSDIPFFFLLSLLFLLLKHQTDCSENSSVEQLLFLRRNVVQYHLLWGSIFRRWLGLLQRSFAILAVPLPRIKITMLLCLSLRPHNHLGSI
jgi:hypothetical protein